MSTPDRRLNRRRSLTLAALVASVAVLPARPATLSAQTFRGRVLDEQDDRPVPTALVHLFDADGKQRAVTIADSAGLYSVAAPSPGVYRLTAERLGYDGMQTPLLEANDPEGVYGIDLAVRRAPLPIRGLIVSADQADRQIRLQIGMSPRSLRREPFRYEEIQSHIEKAHSLGDMLRWSNAPSLLVFRTVDGPCFTVRNGGCLPVYLNGVHMPPEFIDVIPLDMLNTALLIYPNETVRYLGGAVLLYTEAWLR